MLVLTRRAGESITIGDDVVVTVLEVRGGQVRLGIEAPQTVTVLRTEIEAQDSDGDLDDDASADEPTAARVATPEQDGA